MTTNCSAISLTVIMLCVCTKRVCVYKRKLVCKAVRLAFSCPTSAISLPFILIPCIEKLDINQNWIESRLYLYWYMRRRLYRKFINLSLFPARLWDKRVFKHWRWKLLNFLMGRIMIFDDLGNKKIKSWTSRIKFFFILFDSFNPKM